MTELIGLSENNILDRQIRNLRIFTYVCAGLFLGWGIVVHFIEQLNYEIWPIRVGISLLLAGIGLVSKKLNFSLEKLEWSIVPVATIALLYAFIVSWSGGSHPTWTLGCLLIIFGGLNMLSLPGPTFVFAGLCGLVSVLSFVLPHLPTQVGANHFLAIHTVQPPSVILNFWTAIALGLYSSIQKNQLFNYVVGTQNKIKTILDNMHDGVVLHHSDGKIIAINQAAPKILGLSTDQILGKTNFDPQWKTFRKDGSICPPTEHPSAVAQATGKPVFDYPMLLQKGDGSKAWLRITAVPIFKSSDDVSPDATLVTIQDATKETNAQQTVEKQRETLLVASRLTALGEMAAGIAHEINNPLSVIGTRASVLEIKTKKGNLDKEELLQGLTQIQSTVVRIAKIITSMKSLSRQIDTDTARQICLQQIVNDALNISIEKMKLYEIHIEIDIPQELTLDCNPGPLGQVFLNLLNNSVDAISHLQKRWVHVNASYKNANTIEIRFSDSGTGISAELRDKIFLPFYTTKPVGKGTGLGLSLIHSIIQNHNGRIYIDETAANTTFVIELPRVLPT